MTEFQDVLFLAVLGLACFLVLLNLVLEYICFPPAFLARRFAYFRWRRLLAWSRIYKAFWGESPPCSEYFVDFLSDVGEEWLVPEAWSGSPLEWRHDCQAESTPVDTVPES